MAERKYASSFHGKTYDTYYNRICQIPLLNKEKELALAIEIANAKKEVEKIEERKDKLKENKYLRLLRVAEDLYSKPIKKMTKHNLRLVIPIALRYAKSNRELVMDIIDEGNIGLMAGIKKFEHKKNNRLSTYVTYHIKQGITRFLANTIDHIRLPVGVGVEMKEVKQAKKRIIDAKEGIVTIYSLSDETDFSETQIERILGAIEIRSGVDSLNEPIHSDGLLTRNERIDFIKDDSALSQLDYVCITEKREGIEKILDTLTDKEAFVVRERFGFIDGECKTLEEIGKSKEFGGVTRERTRQIEAEAFKKLRHHIRAEKLKEFL